MFKSRYFTQSTEQRRLFALSILLVVFHLACIRPGRAGVCNYASSYLADTLGVDRTWLDGYRSNVVPEEASQSPGVGRTFPDASTLREIRSDLAADRHEDVLARATNLLNQKWTHLDSTSVFLFASMARDAGMALHRLDDAIHFAHLSRYYCRHLPASRQADALIRLAEIQMRLKASDEVREALDAADRILHEQPALDPGIVAKLHVVRAQWEAESLLMEMSDAPGLQHVRSIIREAENTLRRVRQAPLSARMRADLIVSKAVLEHVAGQPDTSRALLGQARRLASDAASQEAILRVRRVSAMLHARAGESERALAEYKILATESLGHAFYRSTALLGITETATQLGQMSDAAIAANVLQREGAHREHRRAMTAIANMTNSNDSPGRRWMGVGLLVLIVTVGWNVLTRYRHARNAVDHRIYVRRGDGREKRKQSPDDSSKWEPIDPKTLIAVVEAEHLPVYRNVRRDRDSADRDAGQDGTGQIEFDLSGRSAVTVSLPMIDSPGDADSPDMRTPNPRSSDPASDGSGVRITCISEAGESLSPLHLSVHLSEAFTTDRLVALQTNAGVVLFYKLSTPGENVVQRRSGDIDLKSVGRVIGIPVAIIESDASG